MTTPRKSGRPVGSRNKKGLIAAQKMIDDLSLDAVKFLGALVKDDKRFLGLGPEDQIEVKDRISASKMLIDKAIANEKDKLGAKAKAQTAQQEVAEEQEVPMVSDSA